MENRLSGHSFIQSGDSRTAYRWLGRFGPVPTRKLFGKGGCGPGIHHIKNGTLLEEGNHTYFGAGVTFLIDNATVNFGGSQDVQLAAGADGSPFLFYENPDGPHPTGDHIFRGDADADYEGIIYTPDRNVEFVGETLGGDTPPDCFAVIANKFHFTGTTDIMLNSDGCGGELEISSVTVRLVD